MEARLMWRRMWIWAVATSGVLLAYAVYRLLTVPMTPGQYAMSIGPMAAVAIILASAAWRRWRR
jgi:hypothetical protein